MVKIAISGKGGVGKTTLTAMLAYLFAKDGYKVTAIDCDSSINLPTVLGITEEIKPMSELEEIIEERVRGPLGTFKYNPKVDDVFEEFSKRNEFGVRVLALGTIEKGGEGCFCPQNAFLRAILRHAIFRKKDVLLLDMEAGIEHLGRGTARGVDLLIAVIEPGMRSVETLKRIEKLASDIGIERIGVVINKYIDSEATKKLLGEIDKEILGKIAYNQCFIKADLENIPPYELGCEMEAFKEIKRRVIDLIGVGD
ncbi:cobalamin biosynthesis protein CobN [Archaeoglobales archaeon]|nr:MAG: cobalamin biosynthesis protein CobN [Archaeoglobales archaeon]